MRRRLSTLVHGAWLLPSRTEPAFGFTSNRASIVVGIGPADVGDVYICIGEAGHNRSDWFETWLATSDFPEWMYR